MIFPASALGWSSKSSRTEYELFAVKNAVLNYYMEHREYPDPTSLFEDLVGSRVWLPRKEEKRIVDSWGHELMVRIPGTHEAIDIHSVGPNGIDQSGAGDDISSWSGVNEGYHYKRTWPIGRALLVNHSICGLVFLGGRMVDEVAGGTLDLRDDHQFRGDVRMSPPAAPGSGAGSERPFGCGCLFCRNRVGGVRDLPHSILSPGIRFSILGDARGIDSTRRFAIRRGAEPIVRCRIRSAVRHNSPAFFSAASFAFSAATSARRCLALRKPTSLPEASSQRR
jgi:hypothetical protein